MLEKEQTVFHPITLKDRGWINSKLREDNLNACEYTFANNYIWAKAYAVQVGEIHECGIIRYKENKDQYAYSFPFGNGDKKAAILLLRGICKAHGHGLVLYPVLPQQRQCLLEWFPGEFRIDADRADFDYLYTVEKLSTLRGKKLHGKRNHIARFMDDGDWRYEEMTEQNIEACRKMSKEWIVQRVEKWGEELEREMQALESAFADFRELGLIGGVLYKNEKIAAFSIGESLNTDTFVVHFEKAYPDLQGAYPMINQQFVLHAAQEYTYVNREEDTGDLGIRKAKLSYYPDILLKKYHAEESHIVFASEYDREAVIALWQSGFHDERAYIEQYLDQRFETENMLVIYADNKPVSMASLLPVQITIHGEKLPARYVYAVATLPDYRRRGYAAELIRFAAKNYAEPLILQPDGERLARYYETLGFVSAFQESPCWLYHSSTQNDSVLCSKAEKHELAAASHTVELETKEALELLGWEVTAAEPAAYKKIRDKYFEREGYVEWDKDAIAYAMAENQFCGGNAIKLTKKGHESVMMYRKEGDKLKIVETTLEEKELREVLKELTVCTGTVQAYAYNEGGMIWLPRTEQNWCCKEGYLNLTLA